MQSKPKLFCFTYAGGRSEFFKAIESDLNGIEVIKLDYAGHGKRHKEDFDTDFNALAEDIFQKVKQCIDGCYALFGYSMGSITLVEVLKRIIDREIPRPMHVFLAAHEPNTWSDMFILEADKLDDWVKQRTIEFGAVPEKLLNSKVFWRTYLPLYRSDYSIIGKYDFEKLELKTDIPATIFYSETDTPRWKMELWKNYFIGKCDYFCYEGKHFFIKEHHSEMADVIKNKLNFLQAISR